MWQMVSALRGAQWGVSTDVYRPMGCRLLDVVYRNIKRYAKQWVSHISEKAVGIFAGCRVTFLGQFWGLCVGTKAPDALKCCFTTTPL